MNNFVGCCTIELIDNDMGVAFPMVVMYPTNTPERVEKLGPYDIHLSINASIKEGIFSLNDNISRDWWITFSLPNARTSFGKQWFYCGYA